MLEPDVGPARAIPHPILFRILDSEADDTAIPEIKVEKKSEWAYYPGCIDYYDQEMQFSHLNYGDTDHGIIFDSSIKLLKAVGIEPVILDRSFMKCCGHDQLWQGKIDVFQRLRDYNTKIIKMLGIKHLVTSCAEGYRTFKLDYKLDGVDVKHITQVLFERGLRLPPSGEGKRIRVAYQDPCRSGRQMPVDPIFEEPRELIERVDNAELVELKTFRGDAQCCGVAQMMYCNDKTKGITSARMQEAKDLDVDYLLTACPKCLTHFGCLHHENRWKPEEERFGFRVIDITQFLAERLEGETPGRPPSVIPLEEDPRFKGKVPPPAEAKKEEA
jgi:Fe-S oxidoreductase